MRIRLLPFALIFVAPVFAQQQAGTQLECHSVVSGAEVGPDELVFGDKVCRKIRLSTQLHSQATEPSAVLILKEGTDVRLKLAQDLSSKTAVDDDLVNLVLDEDLKVGDVTVSKAGAKAVGFVSNAKKAGMMGKGGELNLRLEYLIVGSSRLRLRGSRGREGEDRVGAAVVLTVLFGPIGLIKHGKNVEVKEGTPLMAYVDEDFAVPAIR